MLTLFAVSCVLADVLFVCEPELEQGEGEVMRYGGDVGRQGIASREEGNRAISRANWRDWIGWKG